MFGDPNEHNDDEGGAPSKEREICLELDPRDVQVQLRTQNVFGQKVLEIGEIDDYLAEWNASNPEKTVLVGDRLAEINGVTGPDMYAESKKNKTLKVKILRGKGSSSMVHKEVQTT